MGSFGRVAAVLRTDLRVALRESLIVYVIVAPVFLALGTRMLLPLLEAPTVTFAVAEAVDAATVALLDAHGTVEVLPSEAAVLERVRGIDDVPGVLPAANGTVEVVLEGNEAAWVAAVPSLVLDGAAATTPIDIAWESRGQTHSELRFIVTALMTFSIMLMGGIISGLVVIQQKEEGTLGVYTVSPVRFGEYLTAKSLLAVVPGLVLGWVVAAILLGGALQPVPLLVASLGAVPAALLLGFILSAFANDQVAAVALLKTLLFFFTSVPIAGFFVTGGWLLALQTMTNHWAIQAVYQAVLPGASVPWFAAGMSLLTGLPLVVPVVWQMRRRLGFGAEAYTAVGPVTPGEADALAAR